MRDEVEDVAREALKRVAGVVTTVGLEHMRIGVEAGIRWERERTGPKPQIWFCDRCCTVGVVMYEDRETVTEVSLKIREAHQRYRPACLYMVRVIVMDNLKKDTILCAGR